MYTCYLNEKDITSYVTGYTWSGNLSESARRLNFSIAHTTKDPQFKNLQVELGDTIKLFYQEEDGANPMELFRGRIFLQERNTGDATMSFVAYDDLIYLAKSRDTRKFNNITVESVISQVCNLTNIAVGEITPIGTIINFIADKESYSEMINKAFYLAKAKNNKDYHVWMKSGKLYVNERAQVIEDYIASDETNITSTQHSASIENMINTVKIVNDNGTEIGRITNNEDLNRFGYLQDIYKLDKKQDTQTSAKAMLKSIEYRSSLSAIGNFQCISGYSIIIKNEQLKGRFEIINDSHRIENNIHTMQLELEFKEVLADG